MYEECIAESEDGADIVVWVTPSSTTVIGLVAAEAAAEAPK